MWTYKKAFDRLTEAYINGKVNPLDSCCCFVGNLLDGDRKWRYAVNGTGNLTGDERCLLISQEGINLNAEGFYIPVEVVELENIFLRTIRRYNESTPSINSDISSKIGRNVPLSDMEECAIFEGFKVTLDRLKEIHISKGEVIDEDIPVFVKRTIKAKEEVC